MDNMFVILLLIGVVTSIAMVVWVNNDARSRSIDNAGIWAFIVFISSFYGLLIYLAIRPKGSKPGKPGKPRPCPHCNKPFDIRTHDNCPHCGW